MSSGGWSSRRSKPVESEGDVVDIGAKFGVTVGSDSDSSDAEFAPESEQRDSADSGSGDYSSGDEGGDEAEPENKKEEEEEEVGREEGRGVEKKEREEKGVTEEEGDGGEVSAEVEPHSETEEKGDESTTVAEGIERDSDVKKEQQISVKKQDKETQSSTDTGAAPKKDDENASVNDRPEDSGTQTRDEYNPLVVRRSNRAIKPTKDVDLYLLGAKFGIDVEGCEEECSDVEFAPTEDLPDSVSESSADERQGGNRQKEEEGMEVGEEAATLQEKAQSEDDYSRSVSEFSMNQEAQQLKVEVHVSLCAVCLEDSLDGDIVECDRCGISVHEGCYGVPEDDGVDDTKSNLSSFTTIPWFCDACKAGIDPSTCSCELCPSVGGLFKQATNGRWVHMVCSLYTPGIEYVEPKLLSGVTMDSMPASRWGAKRCQLCDDEFYSKTGVCISCDAGLCKSYFHVTCAQQHGLLCEMDSDDENTDVVDPYFAHCKAHSDKARTKRKRRDFLTVLNKQKKFKFDMSDDRTLHYLSEAKQEYGKFFKKMLNYYRPELTLHLEERLLHFQPSALKRLTQKAQLLGYSIEVDQVGVRRKIAPDLTCEFVNHFNERQTRMKDLQEMEKKLTSSHSELREQELKLKHQVGQLERELNSLRVEGSNIKREVTALYVSVGRISGEQVIIPEDVKAEEEEEEEEERKEAQGLPTCTVCLKSDDPHLMILCDTCDKHYHIMCLDPPLSRVPKKTSKWGWQCHRCCFESGDDMVPNIAGFDEHASRCGRRINAPKVFTYPDDQVKQVKKKKKK